MVRNGNHAPQDMIFFLVISKEASLCSGRNLETL